MVISSKTESGTWGHRKRVSGWPQWGQLAMLCIFTLIAGAAHAQKISKDLREVGANKQLDVIVQFTNSPTAGDLQKVTGRGAQLHRKLDAINGAAFKHLPASRLADLAADPSVAYISPDRGLQMSATTSSTVVYAEQAVMADVAWANGYNGAGVGVAVIDSGVVDRLDLHTPGSGTFRVVYSENFVPNETTTADLYGHGTHVAGIVASNGASANYLQSYSGIAPGASIINLRALDEHGAGTDSNVIAAINRAIQLKSQYNIRIINLSLGRGVFESSTLDPLCQAVESAWKAGIFVAVAAGNDGRDNSMGTNGYGTINSPGIDPFVMTVGATTNNTAVIRTLDVIASYSSKGPTLIDHIAKPDIVAPGNQILSLRAPGSTLDLAFPNYDITPALAVDPTTPAYFRLSGTSMATPVISGAAALLLQQHPDLTPDQIKARLMKTAWKGFVRNSRAQARSGQYYSGQYDIFSYGAGYLDIWAALQNTDLPSGAALSPVAVYNALTKTVTLSNINGQSVCWGSSILWSSSVVWGASVFVDGNSVLWGSSVVWGADDQVGFSVLWGTSVTWGSYTQQALSSADDGEVYIDPTTLDSTTVDSTTTTTVNPALL